MKRSRMLDRKPDINGQIDNFTNTLKLFTGGINIPLSRGRSLENINSLNNNNVSDNIPLHVDYCPSPYVSEGLLFTSKHIKGKLSKTKEMCGTRSV